MLLLVLAPSVGIAAPNWEALKSHAIQHKEVLLKSYSGQGQARTAFAKAVDALWQQFNRTELAATRDLNPKTRDLVLAYNYGVTWTDIARHIIGPKLFIEFGPSLFPANYGDIAVQFSGMESRLRQPEHLLALELRRLFRQRLESEKAELPALQNCRAVSSRVSLPRFEFSPLASTLHAEYSSSDRAIVIARNLFEGKPDAALKLEAALVPILLHECSHFEDDIEGLGHTKQGELQARQIEASYQRQNALKNPNSLLKKVDPEYGSGRINLLREDIDVRIRMPAVGTYNRLHFNLDNPLDIRNLSELRSLAGAVSSGDSWDDLNSLMDIRTELFLARHARERIQDNYSAKSQAYRRQWALDFMTEGSSESLKTKAEAAALYYNFRFDLENGNWENLDGTALVIEAMRNGPNPDFADKAWAGMKEDIESMIKMVNGLELIWMSEKAAVTLDLMRPSFSPQAKAALSRTASGPLSGDAFKPLLDWVERHMAQSREKTVGIPPKVFARLDEALVFAVKRDASPAIKKRLNAALDETHSLHREKKDIAASLLRTHRRQGQQALQAKDFYAAADAFLDAQGAFFEFDDAGLMDEPDKKIHQEITERLIPKLLESARENALREVETLLAAAEDELKGSDDEKAVDLLRKAYAQAVLANRENQLSDRIDAVLYELVSRMVPKRFSAGQ